MDKEQLIKNICTLVDKRINEEFHINSDVAVSMISEYIDQYTESVIKELKENIVNEIYKHTPNRGWRWYKKWEENILRICGENLDE